MDPVDAAFAIKNWVPAKNVIPIHYGSNPLAKGTAAEFLEAMKGSSSKITVISEGQTAEF
jgi:L-ascorbate metabolism protein UlaG (beta-lactamase superfamily)